MITAVVISVSCVEDIADGINDQPQKGDPVEMTFNASFADTRTTLVNGVDVWWEPEDFITINGDSFFADIKETGPSAEFKGETTPAAEYSAAYLSCPYEWRDGDCYFNFSWWQLAVKNQLPCLVSAAKCSGNDKSLRFKSLLGYVKFTVTEKFLPNRLDITANGGEYLTLALAKIDFSGDEPVLVDVEDEYPKEVCLYSDTALEPGDYYVALNPGTFSRGLTFTFSTVDGKMVIKSINQEITLERGVIKNIGEISEPEGLQDQLEAEREALMDFYNATGGDNWDDNTNWGSDKPVSEWYGVSVDGMGCVTELIFYGNNLVCADDLPASMENLKKLRTLILLEGDYQKIPEVIRNIGSLEYFSISGGAYTPLECVIPDWIGELTNLNTLGLSGDFPAIPDEITNLTNLTSLGISGPWTVGGDLGGKLPDLSNLNKLKSLSIIYYKLDIEIPDWIYDMTSLESLILNNIGLRGEISEKISNLKNLQNLGLQTNKLEGRIPDGITELTNLNWLQLQENNLTGNVPDGFSNLKNLMTLWLYGNRLSGRLPEDFERNPNYDLWGVDQNVLLQQSGYGLVPFSDIYESSDYSKDGEVMVLQEAKVTNGVDIVLLGDGFVDKDMSKDGKFEQAMNEALEYLFNLEPMKTYRDYFNVYAVKAVSKNDRFTEGCHTAFESFFGEPPAVSGNDSKVIEYALKTPVKSVDDLTVAVILNSNVYAGMTSMNMTDNSAIAYVGMARDAYGAYPNSFEATLTHEVVGHALAKLGDEYVYRNEAYPLAGDIEWRNEVWVKTGYSANLDLTSDPDQIRWAHMLKDERYSSYTGIVEGGDYYSYGIWRPEENSMMRNNDPYFNAPSREAIVKRIMELAGEEFTFEKFAQKDVYSPLPYTRSNYVERTFEHTPPPVIINGSWRDAVK